jgi:acyl dehydratase
MKMSHFETGTIVEFGPLQLSVDEVKAVATMLDPQPIHLDEAYAQTTRFGGIIASALHAYCEFHKRYWIPLTADTFICGVSFEKCTFAKPVYPNRDLYARLTVTDVTPKADKGTVLVQWMWEILDERKQVLQTLANTTYHQRLAVAAQTA